jgi:hypothetical protein
MKYKESNVLILKPTAKFIPFIQSQLPDLDWSELSNLQFKSTAYVMQNIKNDDDLLAEVERLYPLILKVELGKLIGAKSAKKITGSFFDFLCCFKFEVQPQTVSAESHVKSHKKEIKIKPESVVFPVNQGKITLMDLCEKIEEAGLTRSVEVKNFNVISQVVNFIRRYYIHIFNVEISRMSDSASKWSVTKFFRVLRRSFKFDLHTDSVHLN